MSIAFGVIALVAILFVLIRAPRQKSLRAEERELREYFRRRDAAEARGERFPPY